MDKTVRRVKGIKTAEDGSVVHALLETVGGEDVIFDVVPEAIPLLVAQLMNGRTQAMIKAEAGIPVDVTANGNVMRQPIAASKIVAAKHPDKDFTLVQILMEGGGVFEFLVPDAQLFRQKRVAD